MVVSSSVRRCIKACQTLTVLVFGLTKAIHASLITSHANIDTAGGTPLILHVDDVVVVAAVVVLEGVVDGAAGVVDTFRVVDGAARVVEMARVVDGAAAGVVDNCLLTLP